MEFKQFGGQFVPPHILKAVKEVEVAYDLYKEDEAFLNELAFYFKEYANRPSL